MTSRESAKLMTTTQYESLLDTVCATLNHPDEANRQTLLVLWGSRGSGKTTALSYLASAIADRMPGVTVFGPLSASGRAPDEFTQVVSGAVVTVTGSVGRSVVLLDDLDVLAHTPKAAALYAFEQDVLVKLVQQENVTVVATSQAPITWRDWEIKSRHQTLAIPYLDRAEVCARTQKHGVNGDDAFRLSLGHPQVLDWLLSTPGATEAAIAARAAAYFLDGLPAATAESATLMSLLPAFDVAVLRKIVPLDGGSIGEGFYSIYLDWIRDLVAAGILSWSADTGGYQFLDGVVRCLLARSFRSRRPDDAYRIHDGAARYYQSEATRAGVLRLFIVSVIYHLAHAAALAGAKRPGEPCIAWIQKSLPGWADARWHEVREAWRSGAGDWVVRAELDRLIGAEDSSQITALLETGGHTAAAPAQRVVDASYATETLGQEAAP